MENITIHETCERRICSAPGQVILSGDDAGRAPILVCKRDLAWALRLPSIAKPRPGNPCRDVSVTLLWCLPSEVADRLVADIVAERKRLRPEPAPVHEREPESETTHGYRSWSPEERGEYDAMYDR